MDVLLGELQAALDRSAAKNLLVAYSGGLDSTCLLHAASSLSGAANRQLRALHINHGLQSAANDWQQHCEQRCASLGIELSCHAVDLPVDASEDEARQARYGVFESQLRSDETLLLAHHLDDQLETLLLRLMRGAGPAGLAGMPQRRALGQGQLLRPWLALGRAELLRYASAHELDWVEDASNAGTAFDRNYSRQEILPRLEQRWPAYRESWSKSQTLLAESAELLADLARLDLGKMTAEQFGGLDLQVLASLSPPRQRNVLRLWLTELGLSTPGWQKTRQLLDEYIAAREDSAGVLDFGQFYLQRFQQRLYALRYMPLDDRALSWDALQHKQLFLPDNGVLAASTSTGPVLRAELAVNLQVRYRQGGEVIQLPGRPAKALKKLFQEHGIPPWHRERTPLIFRQEQLVCVPGLGVAANCLALAGEEGLHINWQQPDLLVESNSRDLL